MSLDASCFSALNINESPLPTDMSTFVLSARPSSNLWRSPPSRDVSTAPILYTALASTFTLAEVTITASLELEWDQGGLVIFAGAPPGLTRPTTIVATQPPPPPPAAASSPQNPSVFQSRPPATACKWLKVGLQLCNRTLNATSVCATPEGADWSLATLPLSLQSHHPRHHYAQQSLPSPPTSPHSTTFNYGSGQATSQPSALTVKLERIGYALWVWYSIPNPAAHGERRVWNKLREVTWFFWEVEDKAVRVGVYASRPANLAGAAAGRGGRSRRRAVAAGGPRSRVIRGGGNLDVYGDDDDDGVGELEVEFSGLEIL